MAKKGENIRKRKDGRWEGRFSYKTPEGRNVVKSVYAKTYREAKEKLSLAKTKPQNKSDAMNPKLIFGEMAEEWLLHISSGKKHSTYIKYRAVYQKYIAPELDELVIDDRCSEIFNTFLKNLRKKYSDSLQKSIYSVLNQILNFLPVNDYDGTIRLTKIGTSIKNTQVEILNHSEQAKLLSFLTEEMNTEKLGILICLSTGLRLGEICALKWSDIDLNLQSLHVNSTVQRITVEGRAAKTALLETEPKTACSKREIPLTDSLLQTILSQHSSGEYLINKSKPMEPRTYENIWKRYLKASGIEYKKFHTLRHTFATNCINSGADVKSVSEILGHSDVRITLNRYVHPTMDMKRKSLDRLDSMYAGMKANSL